MISNRPCFKIRKGKSTDAMSVNPNNPETIPIFFDDLAKTDEKMEEEAKGAFDVFHFFDTLEQEQKLFSEKQEKLATRIHDAKHNFSETLAVDSEQVMVPLLENEKQIEDLTNDLSNLAQKVSDCDLQ